MRDGTAQVRLSSLTGQPIFYPVLNEAYATTIARDWNTKDPTSGTSATC